MEPPHRASSKSFPYLRQSLASCGAFLYIDLFGDDMIRGTYEIVRKAAACWRGDNT